MSRFNKYGRKVNEIAKKAFEEYKKAEEWLEYAESKSREFPMRSGMVDAEYATKSSQAYARYMTAKEGMEKAMATFQAHTKEVAELRRQLKEELDAYYGADPAKVDANMVAILNSGIISDPDEYKRLVNDAYSNENYTMARMIAKHAGDAGKALEADDPGNKTARKLMDIGYMGEQITGKDTLDSFDVLSAAFTATSQNPAMISAWDTMTADVVENL